MRSSSCSRIALLLLALCWLAPLSAIARKDPQNAEAIYTRTRPALLQIRTLVKSAANQSSLGSGFLVSTDGLAITNYHVVSQFALQPQTYEMRYAAADGAIGGLSLIAVDVENDLALVRLARAAPTAHPLQINERALRDATPKGERLFAMGNPLDLGFTIVEGTYNGPLERSYSPRIHFTGAINPGMSGGPAVAADGTVVGINVARRLDGQLVSFLVPARFAQALLDRSRNAPPLEPEKLKATIGSALAQREAGLYDSFLKSGFRQAEAGDYRVPESNAPWFTCWADTNLNQVPAPRVRIDTTRCNADTDLFVADDLVTGSLQLSHSAFEGLDVNGFQFATQLSARYAPGGGQRERTSKRMTRARCHDEFVADEHGGTRPLLRVSWCASAYRDFPELYDVSLTAVTQDRSLRAAMLRLSMRGVSYERALAAGRQFIEACAWKQ